MLTIHQEKKNNKSWNLTVNQWNSYDEGQRSETQTIIGARNWQIKIQNQGGLS